MSCSFCLGRMLLVTFLFSGKALLLSPVLGSILQTLQRHHMTRLPGSSTIPGIV